MPRIDQYELLEPLGRGASARVFEARAPSGALVAIKLLHERAKLGDRERRRLEREARALNGLQHPGVVRVLDFGVHDGTPYLVMERLEGMSLRACLDAGVSPDEGLTLARTLIAGLAAVHAAGVLHRDVKPSNAFVTAHGVKLLDFGLAKFSDEDRWGDHSMLTARGAVLGTPAYMPPELGFGEVADERSDVYSAGTVLYEAVEGRTPFQEEKRPDWVRAHAIKPHPAPTRRPELAPVYDRALAKRRDDRFAHAGELLAALEAL